MSATVIDRVRQLVEQGNMSRSGLARAAGLHANTLRDCTAPGWNPTADTLAKLDTYLNASPDGPALATVEEIIEEARNGRMYILVDDEDRENEGDLIIPAQMATPAAINFMATHGRGLICLALSSRRCDELGLPAMSPSNGTRHETAFTVSIEAKRASPPAFPPPTARARSASPSIRATPARISSPPAMSFRCAPAMAGCWCAPGIPKQRWISRGWRA